MVRAWFSLVVWAGAILAGRLMAYIGPVSGVDLVTMVSGVTAFSAWLDSTWLSWAMSGGYPWLWPACETLHFMGLALLMGAVGVLDLF